MKNVYFALMLFSLVACSKKTDNPAAPAVVSEEQAFKNQCAWKPNPYSGKRSNETYSYAPYPNPVWEEHFGHKFDSALFERVQKLTLPELLTYLQGENVDVFRMPDGPYGRECDYFSILPEPPTDIAANYRQLKSRESQVGDRPEGKVIGSFLSADKGFKKDTIFVQVDAYGATLLHEILHLFFYRTRQQFKSPTLQELNSALIASAERSEALAVYCGFRLSLETPKVSGQCKEAVQNFEKLVDLLLEYLDQDYLDEVAAETVLQKSYTKHQFPIGFFNLENSSEYVRNTASAAMKRLNTFEVAALADLMISAISPPIISNFDKTERSILVDRLERSKKKVSFYKVKLERIHNLSGTLPSF